MLSRSFDIVCAGELLIDMISLEFEDSLEKVETFRRIPGGSPANLCMNMARLGNRALLAASVGQDDLGRYLLGYVRGLGVDDRLLRQVALPTTLILVTRSREVSNFEAYRSADARILPGQLPDSVLKDTRIFHTTCFALSLDPARGTLLDAARRAHRHNCQLSIDLNYAEKIWPDRAGARQLIAEYCAMGALVKVSEVDWSRIYGTPLTEPEEAARHFLRLGASQVCVTLGGEGSLVAAGKEYHRLAGRPIDVRDTTGAGDAFWSGYLTAWLDGKSPLDCAEAATRMAERKIGHFGPLPPRVDRESIYAPA